MIGTTVSHFLCGYVSALKVERDGFGLHFITPKAKQEMPDFAMSVQEEHMPLTSKIEFTFNNHIYDKCLY